MMAGILLVDRDGTLIVERNYIADAEQVELLPGVAEGLKQFRAAGFKVAVITNQSGLGRGYFTVYQMNEVNRRMCDLLAARGTTVDGIYHCPHVPADSCACRKPKTELARRAVQDMGGDCSRIICVGDKAIDIEMGRGVGAATVLVLTGYGAEELASGRAKPDRVAPDFRAVAQLVGITDRGPAGCQ